MKVSEILTASSVLELRSFGSYFDIKKILEKEIGNKLGVNGWESLFFKIHSLKKIVSLNYKLLVSVCERNSFTESKKEISNILKLKIKARDRQELKHKASLIITTFSSGFFDPYEHYERTKLKKFKNSSKLEGIEIEYPDESTSLESVLAKYRR
ncbi:hypothetical protein [Nitrosomonas ureae]|uniref:Uncharacterized protein n=1 Tax=Nitrosomonas ureae TaxID=44577 RepID=A0A0S3AIL2_9PROT|nr:hypothetical protein [Nitrosomonas ureae]ALQ51012.1 hypothetical protein ATY38_07085 [Nitrosomonas ureae]PXX15170.1 hypothetical protein C8R27_11152 [Nitrosomonas ureae]SDT85030.1 hypothetical protein SAMN05216406_10337 [Nitrosomonas ureae]